MSVTVQPIKKLGGVEPPIVRAPPGVWLVPATSKHDFRLNAMSVTMQPIKKLGGVEPPIVRAPPGVRLVPATSKHDFRLYAMSVTVQPIKKLGGVEPPIVRAPPGVRLVPATSKRNTSGWLILHDGTQFLSAQHSMACKKFPFASRGNQALSCCVMAIAMSRYYMFDPADRDRYGRAVAPPCVGKARACFSQYPSVNRYGRAVLRQGAGVLLAVPERECLSSCTTCLTRRTETGTGVPCVGKARACFSQYPSIQSLVEKLGPNIPPVFKEEEQYRKSEVRNANFAVLKTNREIEISATNRRMLVGRAGNTLGNSQCVGEFTNFLQQTYYFVVSVILIRSKYFMIDVILLQLLFRSISDLNTFKIFYDRCNIVTSPVIDDTSKGEGEIPRTGVFQDIRHGCDESAKIESTREIIKSTNIQLLCDDAVISLSHLCCLTLLKRAGTVAFCPRSVMLMRTENP
ncbi:Uncharacterized protein OBRU01_00094 [Operophtera brumata]|uniref:Uncharacterized protein n=1 Tax=Operophtera brumata TaxID=104452 RepID=A0A0L7LTQ6_OPEBR|nr:Uncharacterized protein OBRU01_00094 [Operophtera brumata]